MSSMPLSLVFIFSITTAVPCGISALQSLKIFSLIISEAITLSGWSVRVSSSKKWPPSLACFLSSSSNSFIPLPSLALTGTIASKSYSLLYSRICFINISLSLIISILLITRIAGIPRALNLSIKSSSVCTGLLSASTTSIQQSTPPTDSFTERTIYLPSEFFGLCIPGVSKKTS